MTVNIASDEVGSAVVLTFQLGALSECNGMGIMLGVTRKIERERRGVKVIIIE